MKEINKQDELRNRVRTIISNNRHMCLMTMEDFMIEAYEMIFDAIFDYQISCSDGDPAWESVLDRSQAGISTNTINMIFNLCLEHDPESESLLQTLKENDISRLLLEFIGSDKMRMDSFKKRYPKAFAKWTEEEDSKLCTLMESGVSIEQMAQEMQRNANAIKIRLERLGYNAPGAPARPHFPTSSESGSTAR